MRVDPITREDVAAIVGELPEPECTFVTVWRSMRIERVEFVPEQVESVVVTSPS